MFLVLVTILTRLSFSIDETTQCENLEGSTILTKYEHGGDYSDKNLYSCEQDLVNRIAATNCELIINRCKFTHTKVSSNDGVLYISMNNGNKNVQIYNSNFYDCTGGAIYIISTVSNSFEIVNSKFEECTNEAEFSCIYFKASKGNINKCHFSNNIISSTSEKGDGGDIYFEGQSNGEKLTITNNIFERQIYMDDKSENNHLFCFTYQTNSLLEFSHNKLMINKEMTLFVTKTNPSEFAGWTFNNNCLNTVIESSSITVANDNTLSSLIGSLDNNKCTDFECIKLPEGIDESKVEYQCYHYFNFETVETEKSLLSLHYCSFYMSSPLDENAYGGAFYISTTSEIAGITEPFRFYNCVFYQCSTYSKNYGGAIYIQSVETSRLFDFKNCIFKDNFIYNQNGDGGAVYINAASIFSFTGCSFYGNTAEKGGAICYIHSTAPSSSKIIKEENDYQLQFVDCNFRSNVGNNKGGALYIEAKSETKSVEITNCLFDSNKAIDGDEEEERGAGIYFTFSSGSSTSSSKYSLHITGCKFASNEVSYYGGAICIDVKNGQKSRLVEINKCSFDGNKANIKRGSDVYYTYESSASSKSLLAEAQSLLITGCNIENSQNAENGAVYIQLRDQTKTQTATVDSCTFIKCDTPISVDADSAKILKSSFSESNKNAISIAGGTTTIDHCNFVQEAELDYLIDVSSNIEQSTYTNNNIKIKNEKTTVFGTTQTINNQLNIIIEKNTIDPPEDKYIKSENLPDNVLNAGINNGFGDNSGSGGDDDIDFDCPTNDFEGIQEYHYLCGLPTEDSAGYHILNCVLGLFYCSFNNTKDTTTGIGAIYIETKKNLATIKEPIKVYHCNFSYCEGKKGAAISIKSVETERFIEIAHCLFNNNNALSYGIIFSEVSSLNMHIHDCTFNDNINGAIFCQYNSTISFSSMLLEGEETVNYALNVSDCNFNRNTANGVIAAGIHVTVEKEYKIKQVEIIRCRFNNCNSNEGGSICILTYSYYSAAIYHIDDCDFIDSSSIVYNAGVGLIERSRFIDITLYFVYKSPGGTDIPKDGECLQIDHCIFNQTKDLYAIFLIVPDGTSRLHFTNNEINIKNDKTYAFDSDDNDKKYNKKEYWQFSSNILTPPKKKQFKTKEAEDLPASCEDFGFDCSLPECGADNIRCDLGENEEKPLFVTVTNSEFHDHRIDKNGAAIRLINYGLNGTGTTFTDCESTQGGGGGIYIYIDKKIEYEVSIDHYTFTRCKAVYGGGIYCYCNDIDNEIMIKSCTFSNCESKSQPISTTENLHLFSGSAIYLTVKKGKAIRCKYTKNIGAGVKIYSVFDSASLLLDKQSDVSFIDCEFEATKETTSSLFYDAKDSNALVNVVDCIFTGDLDENAHHIDISFDKNNKVPKIQVESCKFSSDKFKAINSISKINNLDLNSLIFNYQTKKSNNSNYNIHFANIMIAFFIVVGVTLIVASVINGQKNKEKDNDNSEEINSA